MLSGDTFIVGYSTLPAVYRAPSYEPWLCPSYKLHNEPYKAAVLVKMKLVQQTKPLQVLPQ